MSAKTDDEVLRENVKLRIAQLDTSISEISRAIGLDRSSVSVWISGNPKLSTLSRLAKVLGIPTMQLLNPDFNPRDYPAPERLSSPETSAA